MARRRAVPGVVNVSSANNELAGSVQQEMFKSLLHTPHRQIDETLYSHRAQFDRDPAFYGKMAIWAVQNGNNSVRDIDDIFIAVLFTSPFQEHRDAAYVLLQGLPPYQVTRVMQYVTGYDEIVKHVSISNKIVPESGQNGVIVQKAKYGKSHPNAGQEIPRKSYSIRPNLAKKLKAKGLITSGQKEYYVDTLLIKHACLNRRTVCGALRSAIKSYLRYREKPDNIAMMEGALIRARSHMYGLYYRTHTLPGGAQNNWLNQYLFHGKIDEKNSAAARLFALKKLSAEKDPVKQAKMIVENRLPYPQVVSVLSKITPTVLIALIDAMSPQELLSNLASLKKRGGFDNPEIAKLITDKLEKIKSTKKRVDALKGSKAALAVGLPEEVSKIATEVTDVRLKSHGVIRSSIAILIDKSGSMSTAIELGKEISAMVAQSCVAGNTPKVYLFDSVPTEIGWRTIDGDITSKSAWDVKLKMCRANGGTEPHTVIKAMLMNKVSVEQIVVITDEGENTVGRFASEIKNYASQFGVTPNIVMVRVGGRYESSDRMTESIKKAGMDVEALVCDKLDGVSLPNLIKMLSRKSIFDLVMEINNLELPTRELWDKNLR